MKQTKSLELLNRIVDAIEDERENVVRAQSELRECQMELLDMEEELEKCKAEYNFLKETEQQKSLELDEWVVAKNESRSIRERILLDKSLKQARKAHERACQDAEEARLDLNDFEIDVIAKRNQKAGFSKEFYGHMMELNEYVTKLNNAIKVVNEHQKEALRPVNFIELFDRTESNKLIIKNHRSLNKYGQNADGSIYENSENNSSGVLETFGETYM